MAQNQQMTTQPKAEDRLSTWVKREETRLTLTSALAGYLDVDEFIAHMLIHIQSKPELAACSVASQYTAMHTCAMLGLLPGFQQVALIPRDGKLTVMPQWQGYKALFERVPEVLEARAGIVHVGDEFETAGDGLDIVVVQHKFDPLAADRKIEKLEDIRGTYARFSFRDGSPDRYHFATAHYIGKCRACAQTKNVWDKWLEQMALKTAFRSAYSRRVIPMDPIVQGRVERFLAHEDALLGNDPRIQQVDPHTIDHEPQRAAAPVSRAAMLARQMRPAVQVASEIDEAGPGETEQITDGPGQEEAQGDQAGPDGGEATGQPQKPGSFGEWLDMSAPIRNERQLRQLWDSFDRQGLPEEVMREIGIDFDKKLAAILAAKQAPLLNQ